MLSWEAATGSLKELLPVFSEFLLAVVTKGFGISLISVRETEQQKLYSHQLYVLLQFSSRFPQQRSLWIKVYCVHY